MSTQSRAAAVAVAALALSLAACSSGGGSPAAKGGPSGTVNGVVERPGPLKTVTYTGTIYVSKDSSVLTKTFKDVVTDTTGCGAAYQGQFWVPTSSRKSIPQVHIGAAGFHGPATYTPADLAKDANDYLLLPGKSGMSRYDITTHASGKTSGKEVLFLDKDGAGQLVYSDAHLNGDAGSPAVAGQIQWKCS